MIDYAKTKIKAGNGGRGIISFRREKYIPKGGPDGGDGGNGGNVYFIATNEIATLLDFQYHTQFQAQNGEPGGASHKKGKDGEDLYIKVPVGSVIKINKLIADLPNNIQGKRLSNEPIKYTQKIFNYKKIEKIKKREKEQTVDVEEETINPIINIENQNEAKNNLHHQQYSEQDNDITKQYQNDTEIKINQEAEKEREKLKNIALKQHKVYKFSEEVYKTARLVQIQKQQINSNESLIFDLVEEGKKVCIARGGRGGRGNARFKNAERQAPKIAERGQQGEYVEVEITLKSIAHVGLVGFPNAGKSTLLSKLTSAAPKIAEYPFTTLEPNLGVMILSDELKKHIINNKIINAKTSANTEQDLPEPQRIIIADLPGLIEGAAQGKGLGFKFLQHIERTQVLLHLIEYPEHREINRPGEIAEHLYAKYQTIRNELAQYGNTVPDKKEIIVINKIDRMPDNNKVEIIQRTEETFKTINCPIAFISAITGAGMKGLKVLIIKELAQMSKPNAL